MQSSQITLHVRGMGCQGCVDRVHETLASTAGVERVSVALKHATAAVSFDPDQVSVDALIITENEMGEDVNASG